jgi:hypothetical protein
MEQTKKKQWKRPEDIVTFRTSNPKEMLGKYLPDNVIKKWMEDFTDEDTGDVVSIERSEVIVNRGYISQDVLQQIMFAIQAGDIEDVEVCEDDVNEMKLNVPKYSTVYNVELSGVCTDLTGEHFVTHAQTIPQAIRIAAEFGQMYRGYFGMVKATRCVTVDAVIVPDDHQCIPEAERQPAEMRKDYFRVTVRAEWVEDMKYKKLDTNYIIAANDVGQAKERIARLMDIKRAEQERKGEAIDNSITRTIRKAVPFDVDCIVPREFSDMYIENPTE